MTPLRQRLIEDPRCRPLWLPPEAASCLVTFAAPTKTFNLAGLGCGFAIIQNPRLRAQYTAAAAGIVAHVSSINMAAAEAAFSTATDSYLHEVKAYLMGNRDAPVSFIDEGLPGVLTTVPSATYLGWLDVSVQDLKPDPFKFMLERARVGFGNRTPFGKGRAGHLRINFACPRLMESLE